MSNYNTIQKKLEQFIKKYYSNELIKGAILFLAIGLLYFIITLLIEYVFWLPSGGRTLLFWLFIAVELGLFVKFIAFPLAKLFNLQKGLDNKEASQIIGNHFPQVSDKLLNLLQLGSVNNESDLLLASIEQKASQLTPIPFKTAIDYKSNIKYLKYAAIPLLILFASYISGKYDWFSSSYDRVVNYKTAYEPPAPFQFFVINDKLEAIENETFTLVVETKGEKIPDNIQIILGEEQYFMRTVQPGLFEFDFNQIAETANFRLTANETTSRPYQLEVMKVPKLLGFDMELDYPAHTKKRDEVIKSSGNAIVPQGTKVTWKLAARSTENVELQLNDTTLFFAKEADKFSLSKRFYKNTNYAVSTSNSQLANYETLGYQIEVVRDQYPELSIQMQQDSTDHETLYFYGQASDDYGLKSLQLVYYPAENEEEKSKIAIPISNGAFDEFVNTFPDQLALPEGVPYQLYFEVFDNDAISGFKSTKSNTYQFRKLTQDEVKEQRLEDQNKTIDDLNNSLEKLEDQDEQLKEFSKTQKEKSELNFNDKKKLENFLERQLKQEEMMQNFNEKMQENLDEFNENKKDEFKESLEERLQENQEQLKKDEALLKELQKIADKISKEELAERLEKLAKQNKNKKRSMEQLLELTKRYYVSQKAEKLKEDLEKQAKEQDEQSEKSSEENTKEKQDELNKKFEDFEKQLDELRKDNEDLKQPMDLPKDKAEEEAIKKEQKEASENLEKQEPQEGSENEQQQNAEQQKQSEQQQQKAKKNQKKAAQKMMKLSQQMNNMMSGGGMEQMSEDVEALRQILDNLVLFSFDQEDLLETFKSIQINHNEYAKNLIKQRSLREHFEHIDDSLFALSLRQPKISEKINKEITEVYFNIDKALEQFSENRLFQGTSAQQYSVTAANTLASFLSDVLDNMEMQMNPSPGKGQGDQQLPDIIIGQQQLNEMMQEGMEKQKGEQKGEKEGEKNEGKNGEPKQGDQEGNQEGEGESNGNSEDSNGELFEIYKRQQQLRQALEDKLGKQGNQGQAKELLKKMEEVELDLLNKGFTNKTLEKMMQLEHQLLKLENAAFQQGQDQKRESKTNRETFDNNTSNQVPDTRKYFNTTEILNRQALPLRESYKKKVQEYFKQRDNF